MAKKKKRTSKRKKKKQVDPVQSLYAVLTGEDSMRLQLALRDEHLERAAGLYRLREVGEYLSTVTSWSFRPQKCWHDSFAALHVRSVLPLLSSVTELRLSGVRTQGDQFTPAVLYAALADGLVHVPGVEKFVFDECDFDSAADLQQLGEALSALPNLQTISFNTCRPKADDAKEGFFTGFVGARQLRSMRFYFSGMGDREVRAFGKSLRGMRELRSLSFIHSGFGGTPETLRKFVKQLRHVRRLEVLSFQDVRMRESGAALLAGLTKTPMLRELCCDGCLLPVEATQQLAAVLPSVPNLEVLSIGSAKLGDVEEKTTFLSALAELPKLRYASLRDCGVGADGLAVLAAAADDGLLQCLESIKFGRIDLDREAASALVQLIERARRLGSVSTHRPNLREGSLELLAGALRSVPRPFKIDLRSAYSYEPAAAWIHMVEAVQSNTHVTDVGLHDVRNVPGADEVARPLGEALERNKSIQLLQPGLVAVLWAALRSHADTPLKRFASNDSFDVNLFGEIIACVLPTQHRAFHSS